MRNMSDDHTHVQEFFTARAADWDSRFPDDGPAYAAAVADLGLRAGDRVLDAGCGTGRALTPLRAAVGPSGVVLGADLTPAMLEAAVRAGRDRDGQLLLADVAALPLRTQSLDAVFAAGLVAHLPRPDENLRELAWCAPAARWRCSTRSAGRRRSRHARADRSPRTTCGPSPTSVRCWPVRAGA